MFWYNSGREELKILSGEVARFGNFCKDPQWHYLDRYLNQCPFSNIMVARQKLLKEDAEVVMQQLMMLVSNTHVSKRIENAAFSCSCIHM